MDFAILRRADAQFRVITYADLAASVSGEAHSRNGFATGVAFEAVPLLVMLFIVVPLVELFVIIQVGGAIGVLPTIGLLLLDSILGSVLMRSQGRAVWRNFQAATAAGKVPAREVLDGALVIFGGALLLTPGFVTDLLGVLLLVPPTRAIVRRMLLGGVAKRMLGPAAIPGGMTFRYGAARRRDPRDGRPGTPADDTVEGTAHDVDPHRLP